jgi:hypothetical protein
VDTSETRIFGRALGALARSQAALGAEERAWLAAVPVSRALDALDAAPPGTDYTKTSPEAEALDGALLQDCGPDWGGRYWNLVLLRLMVRTLQLARPYRVPPAQHTALLEELERIVGECEAGPLRNDPLRDGDFLFDLGLSGGRVLPFGIGIGVVPAWLPKRSDQPSDERPWVRSHLSGRRAKDLTDERAYFDGVVLMAEFLRANPGYGGHFGVGWLGDPSIGDVSPHLAFVRERLQESGATVVPLGRTDQDTVEHATSTSTARRRLYEEGRWTPSHYLVVSPREGFLRWAENLGVPD